MPSPVGHALAGLAIGLAAEPASLPHKPGWHFSRFAILGSLIAALPDADLLYPDIHRGISHSVGMTALVMIVAAAVTGWVTGRIQWRWVLLAGAAHGSHIAMDWMGVDRYEPAGLEALWPFSDKFYISGWDIFPPTERRLYLPGAWLINLRALLTELALTLPIVAVVLVSKGRSRSPRSSDAANEARGKRAREDPGSRGARNLF